MGNQTTTIFEHAKGVLSRLEWKVAIKTGIAAGLSLYLGIGFAKVMEHPSNLIGGTWCVMTTFVVMQENLGGTYHAAWVRFLGVMIGSCIGGFCTFMIGSSILSLMTSVICTVLACSFFNLKDSIKIACLSVAIVNILWGLKPEVSPWTFALFRTLDSILGIFTAVVVAHMIWPSEATNKMRQDIIRTLHSIGRFYHQTVTIQLDPNTLEKINKAMVGEIRQLIRRDRDYLEESELEVLANSKSLDEWGQIIDDMAKIFQSIQKLSTLADSKISKTFDEKLSHALSKLANETELAFQVVATHFETKNSDQKLISLAKAIEELNAELTDYSTNRSKKQQNFKEIEQFFLFFYNLRFIAEELILLQEKAAKKSDS